MLNLWVIGIDKKSMFCGGKCCEIIQDKSTHAT